MFEIRNKIINLRKAHQKKLITKQQFNTLKGQVLSGNKKEATKGLMTILKRKSK